ncbi:hyaluronan-binding protein 2-like isoform X2 [Carassius auratus]|uniref:trypsin n=1 Tax=Carassius auratus TaxID=7957 RepID=A0A6P6NHT5_CARAU|nr:hyaluronan-binding protein 2-like isoform X2 [Carassius auratus]
MNLKLWLLLLFLCALIIPAQLHKDKHDKHDKHAERAKHEHRGKHGRPGKHHGKRGKERLESLKAEFGSSDDSDEDDDANKWLFELQSLTGKCSPNPCLNGGVCDEKKNHFKCKCPKQFVGRRCERGKRVCKRGTCGAGLCLLTSSPPYYKCKCIPPFAPPNCKTLSPCAPNPCQNNGKCVDEDDDFECICPDGFSGQYCQVDPDDCYEGDGQSYRGKVSETEEGDECLDWNSEFLLDKGSFPAAAFESSGGLGPHNFCRNPDGDKKPWCFVKKNRRLRWDYCDVRKCPTPATTTRKMVSTTAEAQPTTIAFTDSIPPKVTTLQPTIPSTTVTPTREMVSTTAEAQPTTIAFTDSIPPEVTTLQPTIPSTTDGSITPESTSSAQIATTPVPTTPLPTIDASTKSFLTCGKPNPKKQLNRIYGGLKAIPGAHPWQVSVQVKPKGSTQQYRHICGGTLIKPCWVLTAAHCINKINDYRVILGGLNLIQKEQTDQTVLVEDTIIHEKFKETADTVYNDIALLKLKVTNGECAKETQFVKAACLPNEPFADGTECSISGWGATETSEYGSMHLLDAQVLLISQEVCSSSKVYPSLLDDGMFCAGYLKGGVDSCQGDSGGPLTCMRNQTHYIYGIVSWGDGCGEKNKPGVYTRVLKYLDWINKKIGGTQ